MFARALRGLTRRPKLSAATIRALVTGEADLADDVRAIREVSLEALSAAVRLGDGDGQTVDHSHVESMDLLYLVWLAALVAWVGGIQSIDWVQEQLEVAVQRVVGPGEPSV